MDTLIPCQGYPGMNPKVPEHGPCARGPSTIVDQSRAFCHVTNFDVDSCNWRLCFWVHFLGCNAPDSGPQ
eukprot:1993537-Rhodomonas_salina.1